MKHLFILILALGCTQKYADYDLIRKIDFHKKTYERPVTLMEVLPQGKDNLEACFNQWLFFSNAEKNKEESIPMLIRSLCPGQDYLVQSKMTETWWTTILFTRACVEVQTLCGEVKKKK